MGARQHLSTAPKSEECYWSLFVAKTTLRSSISSIGRFSRCAWLCISKIDIVGTFVVVFDRDIEGVSEACETEPSVVDWLPAFNQKPMATAMSPAAATATSVRMQTSNLCKEC